MTRSIPFIHIVLVCLLAFSIFGCGEVEDEVEDDLIPDIELHYEIRASPYLDFDAPITAANMLKLIELDATAGGDSTLETITQDTPIFDVTGLEYAQNLVVLHLRYNRIVDVNPLEGLKNLQRLDLRSNRIVDVSPFEGLKNLRWLYLSKNAIVDVSPLEGLRNLQKLWLDNNELVDINPLAKLQILNELYLDNNNIVDVSPLKD